MSLSSRELAVRFSSREGSLPNNDTVTAYRKAAKELELISRALGQYYDVVPTTADEPYPDAVTMFRDLHQSGRILVSTANGGHPVWTDEQNYHARVVHDILGHCPQTTPHPWELPRTVFGFDPLGESYAHQRMLSRLTTRRLSVTARRVMFWEFPGQTAHCYHYNAFPEQTAHLLSQYQANDVPTDYPHTDTTMTHIPHSILVAYGARTAPAGSEEF